MRRLTLVGILASLSGFTQAAPDTVMETQWAPVMSTIAIYARVNNPRQECWTDQVTRDISPPPEHNYGGAVIGGIVGGLLGHTVGNGSGRDAATAVGAVTGAVVGDNMANRGTSVGTVQQTSEERHCRTIDNWTRQVAGYNVIYRYNDREHKVVLPYDPGNVLRVRVSITPIETPPDAGSRWTPPPPDGYPSSANGYPPPPEGHPPPPPPPQ
jgi:uncharacterized protein YcfJ